MKSMDAHVAHAGGKRAALLAAALVALAALLLLPAILQAQTWIGEDFEGPLVSWRTAAADTRYRIDGHARVAESPHGGQHCERVSLSAGPGSYLHLSHDIGQPRIISELRPSVWVRADRAGAQLLARVVFPHATDPATRKPMTAMLSGTAYTQAGQWQQLSLADISTLVARQVRALRAQHGPGLDPREAFLDQLVLNVYAGQGATTVWIDDLEITGFVGQRPGATQPDVPLANARPRDAAVEQTNEEAPQRRIAIEGSVLLVDGRPFYPRIVDYRGEALERLKALGFNAIWTSAEASGELLAEARRARLWVICPPPTDVADLGPRYDPVLAWDLGHALGESELAATGELAKRLRTADRRQPRPLIASVDSRLRDYSRIADIMLFDRKVLGSTLELSGYVELLRGRSRLTRPGTPFWSTVETQPSPLLAAQIVGLSARKAESLVWDADQLQSVVVAALSTGSRGIWFRSYTRLDGEGPGARRRARALEAINLELSLIESWAAEGQAIEIGSETSAGVLATALKTRKSQLLLVSRGAPGSQFAPAVIAAPGEQQAPAANAAAANPVDGRLIVPGVPDDDRPYDLTPGGVRALTHRRMAGGTAVALDDPAVARMIVCTHDPLVLSNLGRTTAESRPRAAVLALELARAGVEETLDVTRQVAGRNPPDLRWLETARRSLAEAEQAHRARDFATSYYTARRAAANCTAMRRITWQRIAASLRSPVTSPLATSFALLPDHWLLGQHLATLRASDNLLAAGDFEDLQEMHAAGWRHFRHAQDEVTSDVELSPSGPDSGRSSLAMYARPTDPRRAAHLLETAPVWITSAPAAVRPGSIVRISGRVRIPRPITASFDGLMIFDSLGGEPLALRLGQTDAWQDFILYRAALSHDKVAV
ncbi:MAG: hypothetical protein WD176_06675, partial [Pirellulales bacterium]